MCVYACSYVCDYLCLYSQREEPHVSWRLLPSLTISQLIPFMSRPMLCIITTLLPLRRWPMNFLAMEKSLGAKRKFVRNHPVHFWHNQRSLLVEMMKGMSAFKCQHWIPSILPCHAPLPHAIQRLPQGLLEKETPVQISHHFTKLCHESLNISVCGQHLTPFYIHGNRKHHCEYWTYKSCQY